MNYREKMKSLVANAKAKQENRSDISKFLERNSTTISVTIIVVSIIASLILTISRS